MLGKKLLRNAPKFHHSINNLACSYTKMLYKLLIQQQRFADYSSKTHQQKMRVNEENVGGKTDMYGAKTY